MKAMSAAELQCILIFLIFLYIFKNIVLLNVSDFHAVCFDVSRKLIELCTVHHRARTSIIVMATNLVYHIVFHQVVYWNNCNHLTATPC